MFPALGLSIQQSNYPKTVNQVKQETCPIKKQIAANFPSFISRIVKSKLHTVRSKFHKNFTPTHQKGRRGPMNLLHKVSDDLKKLSDQGHIEKLLECSDKNFISLIVITVKKEKSVKLALEDGVEKPRLCIEAIGVLCGDKPWKICDRKASSLMYLSLETEGRRVFNSKNSTVNLDEISTLDLWDILNTTFNRIHNITFDRYLFLTRKQQKGEPNEKFYGHLKELSENCDLGEKGDTVIRDVLISNIQKEHIQKELLKETTEPDKNLAIAINIEMGTLKQLKNLK